jgi:hypothetical protein
MAQLANGKERLSFLTPIPYPEFAVNEKIQVQPEVTNEITTLVDTISEGSMTSLSRLTRTTADTL